MIDLRSDTVTKPTLAMREAMLHAEVGDDVFGEDPMVNLLQDKVAKFFGKEASIFVSSGTMGNGLCIKAQTVPGDEVIVERDSHIFNHESGAAAALAGVQLYPIEGEKGIFYPEQIEKAVRSEDYHYPVTRLICIENTHNQGGGSIYPPEVVKEISQVAKRYGLSVHMDGARLLNATVALGIDPIGYTRYVDSVTLCLSKGLGAPVGSMVAGTTQFIQQVRRFRKMYGGGMRQVGFLAAAGLYALKHHVDRLAEDHQKAKKLAEALNEISDIQIEPQRVETNILYFKVIKKEWTAQKLVDELRKKGILILLINNRLVRAVTHLDVSWDDIEEVILAFQGLFY